jgi:hypothetical protein
MNWVDHSRISAAAARDVRERRELAERGGHNEMTYAQRAAQGRQGRSVVLFGKRKLARARESEPVA